MRLEATRFPRDQLSVGHTGAFCKGNASSWLLTASLPDVRPIPPKEATEPRGASWKGVLLSFAYWGRLHAYQFFIEGAQSAWWQHT